MKKRILSMLLVIVMVLSLVPVSALAEGYTITSAKKSVVTGEELELTADGAAETDEVTWTYTSEDGALVAFSATTGKTVKMTGQRQGTVTVKAECGTKSDEKTYTVYQTPNDLAIIDKDTGIAPVTTLLVGDKLNLDFTCSNMGTITKKSFVWGSTDEAVVKVSNTGALEAMGAGDATVTLRFNGGRAELPVHVDTLSATISGPAKMVIGRTQTFTVAFAEGQPVPTEIAWSFTPNDTSVSAEVVSNGTTATIKATGKGNGFVVVNWGTGSESVPLEIVEASALSIQKDGSDVTELTLTGRETVELTAVLPDGEAEKDIVWTVTSADNAISETHSGTKMTVTGEKLGTATVTAKIAGDDVTEAKTVAITVVGKSRIANPVDTLFVGDTHTCVLETELLDETAFTWESSDIDVATVSAGVVTPVKSGSATISVKNGTTVLDSFPVEVKAQSRIEIDPEMPRELLCGQDMTLKAVFKDAEGKVDETASIKWKLVTAKADDVVLLVGDKLTALPDLKNPYVVTIEAYAVDAEGKAMEAVASVSCDIKVIPTAHQVLLTLNGEDINGKTIKLNVNDPADAAGIEVIAKINPSTADQGIFWSLGGDGTICTYLPKDLVDDVPASVVVKPVGANKTGTITVTAAARTNKQIKAQFTVEFTKLPTSLEILGLEAGKDKNFLRGGDNLTLRTNLEKDSTLTNRRVIWEVTGVPGATIENGVLNTPAVTAATEITVTATAEATGVQDIKYITLYPSVASIAITQNDGSRVPAKFNFSDGPIQLKMTATPADNMGKFEWTSSDWSIAEVDQTGKVTFKDAGTVRITCAALDGSNVKTNVNLIIEKKAGYVEVDGVSELVSGKSAAMTATVYVDDTKAEHAANQEVTWSVVGTNFKSTSAASINARGRLGAKTVNHGVTVYVIARSVENGIESDPFEVCIQPKKAKTFVATMFDTPENQVLNGSLNLNLRDEVSIFGQWYTSADNLFEDEYDCSYFTSNSSVASIDAYGTLKAKKAGTATITVRAIDEATNKVYTAKFTLKVANLVGYVQVSGPSSHSLKSGQKMTLSAKTWTDSDMTKKADNQGVNWKVYEVDEFGKYSTAKAAAVNTAGKVTAKDVTKNTPVVVVAISKENSEIFGYYELTIRPKNAYTLRVCYDEAGTEHTGSWKVANATELANIKAMAYNASSGADEDKTSEVTWTSDNAKVIKVVNNKKDLDLGGKTGKAKITAKLTIGKNVYTASMTVYVVKPVTSLTVAKKNSTQELYSGKTLLMAATVNPTDATNKQVKWEIVSGGDYATINANTGLIRAYKVTTQKTITVKATALDGSGASNTATVTLYPQATKVTIEKGSKAITKLSMSPKDASVTLTAVLDPVGQADSDAVKWSSSRSGIVTVDKTGKITPKRKGMATIKATATDGSGKYATVVVTVQ